MVNFLGPGAFGCARPSATLPPFDPANNPGDQDDFFKDCSSELARDGTEWRSSLLNFMIGLKRSFVRKNGISPSNLDLHALTRAGRRQGANFVAAVGGTVNAVTVVLDPPIASYGELTGAPLRLLLPTPNTAANPTVNVDGQGAIAVKRPDGAPIAGGEFFGLVEIVFDGTNFRQMTLPVNAAVVPIFPEILSGGATLALTPSTGQVTVDTGVPFVWRGVRVFSTSDFSLPDRSFATAANKTYHLRWHAPGTGMATPATSYPNGRFELLDQTAASPAETDPSYDSTFDRMLVAKIVTSGGNVPTITPLANRSRLVGFATKSAVTRHSTWTGAPQLSATINWARTPTPTIVQMNCDAETDLEAFNWCTLSATRYAVSGFVGGYMLNTATWSPNTFISGGMTVKMEV